MRRLPLLVALPLALLLSGCFQVFSTLTVRPDGSGQLVERITAEGAMAMGMMMMDEMPGDGPTSFEARAASLGDGVTLASVEETYAPGAVTYLVTYEVPDVNGLAYSMSDAVDPDALGDSMMGGMMGGTETPSMEGAEPCRDGGSERCADGSGDAWDAAELADGESDDEAPYRFAFTPAAAGQAATLVVTVPERAIGPGELDVPSRDETTDGFNQMLVLLGTMAMQFDVAVEGATLEADRGWVDGDRVTLSQIQLGEMLEYARDEIADGDVQAYIDALGVEDDVEIPGLRAVAPGTVTIAFE